MKTLPSDLLKPEDFERQTAVSPLHLSCKVCNLGTLLSSLMFILIGGWGYFRHSVLEYIASAEDVNTVLLVHIHVAPDMCAADREPGSSGDWRQLS